jgi:hypothetical protein
LTQSLFLIGVGKGAVEYARRSTVTEAHVAGTNAILIHVLIVLVFAYAPARMGAQVIGGLDSNNTVNAWGGPSYLGAMLAHYLDALVGFYAACFLLGRLLLPASDD